MKAFRFFSLLFVGLSLSGCHLNYLIKSGYEQAKILSQRIENEKVLADPNVSEEKKRKLRLIEEARHFAEEKLGLTPTKNYTSFVQLDRPYVSYIISAAPQFDLESYLWTFPIVGSVPYIGYFSEDEAKSEAIKLKQNGFDTYVRGASAYSTLGYFKDPVLSSMLNYKDSDLVNLIIHETVHATLYIKNSADFNERMAVFLGNKGTEQFYLEKEGPESKTLTLIKDENSDENLFSEFITQETNELKVWYKNPENKNLEQKGKKLGEIKKRFQSNILNKLKTESYKRFNSAELNNAYLLSLTTYVADLQDFENAFIKNNSDFIKTIHFFKQLEKSKNPEVELKKLVAPL